MEERLEVLNLLEEGKVTVDEAVRLLAALGGSCCKPRDEECRETEKECCDQTTGDEPADSEN